MVVTAAVAAVVALAGCADSGTAPPPALPGQAATGDYDAIIAGSPVADAAASSPPVDPRAPSAQLEAGVAAAAAAGASATTLERDLRDGGPGSPWSALPPAEQRRLLARVVASREKAQRDEAAARQEHPGVALERDELHAHLSRAVGELPERRRLVVLLRWQHQLSNGEIARVLGISEKGVETQFGRALAALRKRFARFAP